MNNCKIVFLVIFIVFLNQQCKVETKPQGELLIDEGIKTENDIQQLMNGAYNELANSQGGFYQMVSEFMVDNLAYPNNNDYREVYNHNVLYFNSSVGDLIRKLYKANYFANFAIDKISLVNPSASFKEKMEAEKKFINALTHFAIVRLWAQPYGFTANNSHLGIVISDDLVREPKPRASVSEVYAYIVNQLLDCINKLPTSNSAYATKSAAQALLAEVYFQMGKYNEAGDMANTVITTSGFVFSDTSNWDHPKSHVEHIFSIISTSNTDKKSGGFTDNYNSGSIPLCTVSKNTFNLYGKDTTDKRVKNWVITNAGKSNEFIKVNLFNAQFFNVPLLTITQMKLIRAESYAKQNLNLTTAVADINDIIGRAYKNNLRKLSNSSTATQIIDEARYQRRIELMFTGNRVNEVKRLGAIENQNILINSHPWNCKGFLLQFPATDNASNFEFNPTGGCD